MDRGSIDLAKIHPVPSEATAPFVASEPWRRSPREILDALCVDAQTGLTETEADRRRRRWGENQLREAPHKSAWTTFARQLKSPIVLLLVLATVVAYAFDEKLEAAAVAAVLVVNTMIGFFTERRATRAVEALRELGAVHSVVRRAGVTRSLPATELVPGDIVVLDAGDVLAADLRILQASRLQVDESTLTGESLAVTKTAEPTPESAALPDRTSMLYSGTAITRGSAEGVVIGTGMATELGQISQLVDDSEPERTPLEIRLNSLGRRLILLTLGLTVIVSVASLSSGRELYLSIEIALALAVAAVPEGLPIVATVALARGMWRMARRNALIEELSAVETLGSTNVLLVDKTGTLTENRMTVGEIVLPDHTSIEFDRQGDPTDDVALQKSRIELEDPSLLESALRIGALCNNAELGAPASLESEATGDPTEVALLVAARSAGIERPDLLRTLPEIREIAFDSEAKKMATLHRNESETFAAIKGAPEAVLSGCTHVATSAEGTQPLDAPATTEWLGRADEMAASGQRVLALASRTSNDPDAFAYDQMTFLGLVGLIDPPRFGVRDAMQVCRDAGIRPVMVTGDHAGTAWHIAGETGLISPEQAASPAPLDARTLPDFSTESELDRRRIMAAPVIARATPKQKLDLISLYQQSGAVVAMTGDGVNDAPALKKSDIGVAMGKRGTQVAREAADMVLQDDEFATIVAAVSEGRAIYSNIRKFVVYLLSCNLSEIVAVAIALLAQIPLPLLPLQILFLNLVTDVFPALALGVGEGGSSLMRESPRAASEPLVTAPQWFRIAAIGAVMAAAVLAALWLAIDLQAKTIAEATTISFVTLALAQIWHVFGMREVDSSVFRNEITRNPWIWAAIGVCVSLVVLAVSWPPLTLVLSTSPPDRAGWILALSASLIPVTVGQIELLIRARRKRKRRLQRATRTGSAAASPLGLELKGRAS